jgi:hypothetical protein
MTNQYLVDRSINGPARATKAEAADSSCGMIILSTLIVFYGYFDRIAEFEQEGLGEAEVFDDDEL